MSEHDNQGTGRFNIIVDGGQGAFSEANPSTGMHQQVSAKIIAKQNDDSYLSEAESERLVAAYIKFKSRYIPDIDYKKPETFAYFGLARKYYEDTIKGIYESYPYDGSRAEKMEWALSASYLDLYFLEHEYPKAKGHITFDRTGDTIDTTRDLPTTDNPQYIEFTGGPHVGTVYDSANNRESNIKVDGSKGNTIEFWLKKDEASFYSSHGRSEVVFNAYTPGYNVNDHEHGQISVFLENGNSSESPISVIYSSGSHSISGHPNKVRIGSSAVTKASVGDNKWHHYAITFLSDDTSTITKLYIDGELDSTRTDSVIIGPVDRPFIGTIGGIKSTGAGKLSGSLDEIRFWKEARTEKEIGRFWYSPVHGGTDKDHTNANLGLYYKFNEGITGVEAHDKVVLDYSGRVGNGEIIGWDNNMRSPISGIEQSEYLPESGYTEVGDPIINANNSLVIDVQKKFKDIGISHDASNMASLINSVPDFLKDEDPHQLFVDLLQIMASSFDDMFLKVKNIPKMKDFTYQEFFKESGKYRNSLSNNFLLGCEDTYLFEFTGNYTKPWVDHILQHFGLVTTEIFPDATLFETFFKRSERLHFEHGLVEVKNTILSNIHKNLVHILKTKGTEQSFRNLIRCFGIDSELIKLNAYGKNEEYEIKLRPVYETLKAKTINFESQNIEGTLYHTASEEGELDYIPAETSKKPLSLTANFLFPKKTRKNKSEVTRVSLFGIHSVSGSSTPSTPLLWHTDDIGSFQVYFKKREENSKDGHFELTSSAGTIHAISSSLFPSVYDNSHWNISVRIGNKTDVELGSISPSSQNKYLVEFTGYQYELDVLTNSFYVTSSISETQYTQLSTKDKAVYLGAHRKNFTGSLIESSDVRAFGISAWRDILENQELQQYAQNPSFYGRKEPLKITKFDDGENLKQAEALILRWQFENLTGSNSANQMNIVDYSGKAGVNSITNRKYPGLADSMVDNNKAISQEFLPVVEYNLIDNLYGSDKVKIKETEVSKFEPDSRPITYFYNFEKSMFQIVSSEMINMFAGLTGYNTLIGEPVNKYRIKYKSLEKLRERFFRKVKNDIDLDKFVEYYRWIDYSLTSFLNQMIPATSDFGQNIKNVVESHVLERNKYQHKAPSIRMKEQDISANAISIGDAGFNWALEEDWFEKQVTGSLSFASAGAVEVEDADDLTHSNSPDAPFAISFWFNLQDTTGGEQTLLIKPTEYSVKVNDDDLEFTLFTDSSNHTKITAANTLGTDWTNVVVTYDGTLDELSPSSVPRKIYVNGSIASTTITNTGTYTGMTGSTNNLIIGADDTSGTNNFNGQISDIVMVTGSELSAAQALEFYNGGPNFDVATHSRYSDVMAWWKMGDDEDTISTSSRLITFNGHFGLGTFGSTYSAILRISDGTTTVDYSSEDAGGGNSSNSTKIGVGSDRDPRNVVTELVGKINTSALGMTATDNGGSSSSASLTLTPESGKTITITEDPENVNSGNFGNSAGFTTITSSPGATIRDYRGNHNGTPSNITISTQTKVYNHIREISPSDPRFELHKSISQDIQNSLQASRFRKQLYRLMPKVIKPITSGLNSLSHTPFVGLNKINKGETLTLSIADMVEVKGKIASEFPFTFTSASNGITGGTISRNFPITNNHIDMEISRFRTLKGTFADTHVGGMPHRNVAFGTANSERPEAYSLNITNNSITMSATPINKPKSMFFRGVSGTRFINFSNIKTNTATNIVGNYERDYEIIQIPGRDGNNRYLLEDSSWLSNTGSSSTYISGVLDLEVPQRSRSEHIITNRFSSIGGPETTTLTRDRETEEFSVYNTINYRNSIVRAARDTISKEYSEKFGFRSGSATQGSIHKINRNPQRFLLGSEKAVRYDNEFVQHPIPQTDHQYSWVTSAVETNVYNFLERNNNRGYVGKYPLDHEVYTKDFSTETIDTIPSEWQTNYSQKTSSFMEVGSFRTLQVTASGGSLPYAGLPVVASDNLVLFDNAIYRSSSSGYSLEKNLTTRNHMFGMAINESEDLVAVIVNTGSLDTSLHSIDMYRSSSVSGWAIEAEITGGFAAVRENGGYPYYSFFSGSSLVYIDATNTSDVAKRIKWYTSSSVSGWQNNSSSQIATNYFDTSISGKSAYSSVTGHAVAVDASKGFRVLRYDTSSSDWVEARFESNNNYGNQYGFLGSVAISDEDSVAVGFSQKTAFGSQGHKMESGLVRIYWSGSSNVANIRSPYKDFQDGFGADLSFSGSFLAIGSPEYDATIESENVSEVENDKGAAYIYRVVDSSETVEHQSTLYSTVQNPRNTARFGSSVSFHGQNLAIETPGEGDTGLGDTHEATNLNIYTLSPSSVAVDRKLFGPIITGSSSNKAFVLKGSTSTSPEISEFPSVFSEKTGNQFRTIETLTPVDTDQDEFTIKFKVLEGSTSSSDSSNTVYGLTDSPSNSEILSLQYKIGSGAWKTAISIAGSGTTGTTRQNNFVEYSTGVIVNNSLENVNIRIIANTVDQAAHWAVKEVKTENVNYSKKSSEKLIKTNIFRRDVIKNNSKQVRFLAFTDPYFTQLTNYRGATTQNGPGVRTGDHDSALHWSDSSSDFARSLSIWIKPSEASLVSGTESYIVSSGTSAQSATGFANWSLVTVATGSGYKIKMTLKGSSTLRTYHVTTKTSFAYEEWKNISITYDGNGVSTISGLKIYVNGILQEVETNRASSTYDRMPSSSSSRTIMGHASYNADSPNAFVGKVKNFSLINKEINLTEVQEIYNVINNIDENYSLSQDPLSINGLSFNANLLAHWVFNGSDKTQLTLSNNIVMDVYTDIIGGYELLGEVNPQPTVHSPRFRKSPSLQTGNIEKIIGTTQSYDIDNYTTLSSGTSIDYLKNALGPYTYNSWTQLRAGEGPAARKQRRENKITISVRDNEIFPVSINRYYHDLDSSQTTTPNLALVENDREVEVYDEVFLSKKYYPLVIAVNGQNQNRNLEPTQAALTNISQSDFENYWSNSESFYSIFSQENSGNDPRVIVVKATAPNDLTMFSNDALNERLEIDEHKSHNVSQIIQGMQQLAVNEGATLEVSYKETIYPREVNTFTKKVRTRSEFDFYSWRNKRSDRNITLSGSNVYGTALVNFGNSSIFPEITYDKYNYTRTNEFFVDSVNIDNRFSSSPKTINIKASRWPLDSRSSFSSLPSDIKNSYYNQGDLSLTLKEGGTKGEGVLQNDYSIFGLGYNGLFGTPPASSLYSRRIPQTHSGTEYLAGEAKWEAAEQSGKYPYENSNEVSEKLRSLWKDHSLVPEYKVSEFIEDIVLNQDSDFSNVQDKGEYFSVTGAIYHTSSQNVTVGTKFFKTYGTSDFMKYFGMTFDEVRNNNIGGPAQLTLKCQAAIKFTPYRGFYPVERSLQIGEIFSRGYMPEFTIDDERQTAADQTQVTSPKKLTKRKIRANLQQSLKPFMSPGVLYNSIKSGLAVDYPIFGSSTDETALSNFDTAIGSKVDPVTSFDSSLSAMIKFTGSTVNSTTDTGIPRLSGSVSKRITFEDLLDPQRIIGTKIFDNEPHPSASIYYGDGATSKVFDYPFKFGELETSNNQRKMFAGNFTLTKTLDDTLTPYKMAINNFCAETVNFFLEGGRLSSLESDQVNPNLISGSEYKMRVYVKNNSLVMYDRHSSFGPPVDEGAGLTKTQISGTSVTNPGAGAKASLGTPVISIAASAIGAGSTNFQISDTGTGSIMVAFRSGSTGSDITTGTYGPAGSFSYDVSQYGNVYVNGLTSSVDLASIESSSEASTESINKLLEVAINYHRWEGDIDIEANFVDGNIQLRQLTTGSSGNTAIVSNGNMTSLYPSMPSEFSSGRAEATDYTGISRSQITDNSSHEFAPFVPPFLDQGAEPYVEISFTPSETRDYSLEEILQSAEYTYSNFKEVPSNSGVNTNYKEAMSISAALDLKNFVAYKEGENLDPGTTLEQRKRWVIQTKWETPILNFRNVSASALNLSTSTVENVTGSPWQERTWNKYLTKSSLGSSKQYLTASTGMWHQYGSLLNSNEGYTISIGKVEGIPSDNQLAKKVGFIGEDLETVSVTPGKIAKKKEVSEAVIAIPFYVEQIGNKMKFFTVRDTLLSKAKNVNKKKKKEFTNLIAGKNILSAEYQAQKEEYMRFYNNPGLSAVETVAYQMRMMEKFVFPPQFDYYTYPDLSQKPMMYVFQFNATFNKQDLANIWQNLSPSSIKSGAEPRGSSINNPQINGIKEDVQYVSNFLTKKNIPWSQRKAFFTNNVRWLIFKVKQRAETDLSKIKIKSLPGSKNNLEIDNSRTSIKESEYLSEKKYSYNWPYDYFSLVELIKVEGKVNFSSVGEEGDR